MIVIIAIVVTLVLLLEPWYLCHYCCDTCSCCDQCVFVVAMAMVCIRFAVVIFVLVVL